MHQKVLLLSFLLSIFVPQARQQSSAQQTSTLTAVTCYDWGGVAFPNNFQCPGSRACCGDVSECTTNLFCERNNTLIRPTCLSIDFNDCSQLCHYSNALTSGKLPRATKCDDGSYCCDNQPSCCIDGLGVQIDAKGNIISTTSSRSTTSTSPTSSTTSSSTESPSSTTSSTASQSSTTSSSIIVFITGTPSSSTPSVTASSSESKSGISKGVIGGIVAAIVIVLAITGLVVWILHRHSKKIRLLSSSAGYSTTAQQRYGQQPPPAESTDYLWTTRPVQRQPVQTQLAEMHGTGIYDRVVELPSDPKERHSSPRLSL